MRRRSMKANIEKRKNMEMETGMAMETAMEKNHIIIIAAIEQALHPLMSLCIKGN